MVLHTQSFSMLESVETVTRDVKRDHHHRGGGRGGGRMEEGKGREGRREKKGKGTLGEETKKFRGRGHMQQNKRTAPHAKRTHDARILGAYQFPAPQSLRQRFPLGHTRCGG